VALTLKEQTRYRAIIRQLERLRAKGFTRNDHPDFDILIAELDVLADRMTNLPRAWCQPAKHEVTL
jgi:hypothetical protein